MKGRQSSVREDHSLDYRMKLDAVAPKSLSCNAPAGEGNAAQHCDTRAHSFVS
jgi:hypothetical protein